MFERLVRIDELVRRDHFYLGPEDECYFLGEYSAGQGFNYSETNQLISNLKKPLQQKNQPHYRYKGIAINSIVQGLAAMGDWSNCTIIPVPPSKEKADPNYDDRMHRIASGLADITGADYQELILQTVSTEAMHGVNDQRPKPDELAELYEINVNYRGAPKDTIVIIDDVITTGTHFKAMKLILTRRFPGKRIIGLFVARRVPPNPFDDFNL